MFDINPDQLEEFSKKIAEFLPEAKRILPQLKQDENEYRSEHNLTKSDHIFYACMLTDTKLVVYVFAGIVMGNTIEIEGKKYGKGSVLLHKQLKRFELIELMERTAKEGLVKIAAEFATGKILKQLVNGK